MATETIKPCVIVFGAYRCVAYDENGRQIAAGKDYALLRERLIKEDWTPTSQCSLTGRKIVGRIVCEEYTKL